MRSRLVVRLVAVAAAAAAGLYLAASSRPGGVPDAGVIEAPRTGADTPAAASPATGRRPAMPLAEAMKELDLIKPSRQKRADDFTLPTPAETPFRLSDHRGKVVMINFWATWCPPCVQEMPAMERLYRKHREAGFVMVAVSLDANSKVVPPFVARHKLSFPIALDPKMEIANAYSVRALPSSFLVDRSGNLAALAIGPRRWDNVASDAVVEGLLR